MKKNQSVVCVIPSRSQGDQINNLNFLYVGEKMLLEFTILSALKSKIFAIIERDWIAILIFETMAVKPFE